jgi:hypothetical protein
MQIHVKTPYVISCQKRNLETTSHSFEHNVCIILMDSKQDS